MTDMVVHEIAWLLLGAAAIGSPGAALRQPQIVSFIAVETSPRLSSHSEGG